MSDLRDRLWQVSDPLRAAALAAGSIDDALVLARLYARLHWDNISGYFSDEALEAALFERWGDLPDRTSPLPACDFLHVATQVYAGGGHSRLLRQLVGGLDSHGSQALLLTGKAASSKTGLPRDTATLSGRPGARAAQMVAAGRNARTVLLHIHPDDAAAALAARVLQAAGTNVLFVNHADHVFTLGPGAAGAVLDVCVTGSRTTRDRRAARAQSFMGIPVVNAGDSPRADDPARTGPIVSMGGPEKFRPYPGLSFPDFLADLLARVPNDVILIGPRASDPWWSGVCAAFPGRISLRGTLPPADVSTILASASVYVDSFPLDGGTAFPQSVFHGPPGFGLNAQDAPGVGPADALRVDSATDLADAVAAYLQGGSYPFDLAAVRRRIATDFSDVAVAQRVLSAAAGDLLAPLDYLLPLGQRDSDYNARRWERDDVLHLPKRIWRQLSLRARLDLNRRFARADLTAGTVRTLRRRLVVG